MIDASRDFIKDGNKNRLRERDVYKITTVFNSRLELPKYSRFVPNSEIKEKNAYNLNIPATSTAAWARMSRASTGT
jgi:type I restriction enzyme M protein